MSEIVKFLEYPNNGIDPKSPSALWIAMVALLYKTVVTGASMQSNMKCRYRDNVYVQ